MQLTSKLLFMGREYPQGYQWFRTRCHAAFSSKKGISDENEIRKGLEHGEYVKKGRYCLFAAYGMRSPNGEKQDPT